MLYVHIGTGKTGTTSIQTFLAQNVDALLQRNIVVPRTPGRQNHLKFTMYALNDDVIDNTRRDKGLLTLEKLRKFQAQFVANFEEEIATFRPDQTIVITSEQMTRLRREGELERLKALLDKIGHQIKIVVYLRRQDHYFLSEYSQLIKGGLTLPLSIETAKLNMSIYDHSFFCATWARVFGKENIIVRPYERSQLKDGDVVADFLEIIGLQSMEGFVAPGVKNLSLDANTVEFLRLANEWIPRWVNGKLNPKRNGILEALEKISDGPKLQLSREQRVKFLERFAKSSETVAREYLGREDGVLFRDPINDDEVVAPAMTLEKAVEIAAKLWNNLPEPSPKK